MFRTTAIHVTLVFTALLFLAGSALGAEFPLREKYPNVKPITLEDLNANYDSTIIIDVRAKDEFDVIHIKKAEHIPVTKATFSRNGSASTKPPSSVALARARRGIEKSQA